ncbi:tetratricopeptide repeat protein [Streptosporangium sp. NPDC004631]
MAISGVNHGDIHLSPVPAVRSAYRQQVRRIAPPTLVGRDEELAELAAFCTAPAAGGGGYVWWQAPAWAGKSALLSWFVLNPPPGVRVVSFFITARYAGQSDRVAFIDAVLEQLAEVVGESLPAFLTSALKESHLLDLLDRAVRLCRAQGVRLVLVVDGLDEDRGVVVGPEAYSIAALLPTELPEGMRVVVAGRPHPPVPSDVPDDHPLRDPCVVRRLERSPDAQVIRRDAERELKRLLHGSEVERDLLGLVVAAGGGLSGPDLAELAGLSGAEVEEHLCAVSGRTFTGRAGQWQPGAGPVVYVLAHEELQNSAVRYLGGTRLEGYRQRLHAWADGYRDRGWPPGTPEYLLRGYFRLLQATDDHDRMAVVAVDRARHDRMLDITGGDAGALAEIAAIQHVIRSQAAPDLLTMLRLAIARNWLTDRNANTPVGLPAVWAKLGHIDRAEALARSITDPQRQASSLAELADEVVELGDLDRARRLVEEAEALARSITDPDWQASSLAGLVGRVAKLGDLDRAEALARSITDPQRQASSLAGLADEVVELGDLDRARRLVEEAEALARSITDPQWQALSLAGLVGRVAKLGDLDRARRLVEEAEALARSITDPHWQASSLAGLAYEVAKLGDLDRAEALARSITGPHWRAWALAGLVVGRVVELGDLDRARRLVEEAEALARSITDPDWQALSLAGLAYEVAKLGDLDRAEALARSITYPYWQAWALAKLAEFTEPVRSRQLIVRALCEGSWTIGLSAITHIEPDALIAITDEFLADS